MLQGNVVRLRDISCIHIQAHQVHTKNIFVQIYCGENVAP